MAEHFTNEEAFLRACEMPLDEVAAHVEAHSEILEQYDQLNYDRLFLRSTLKRKGMDAPR